MELTISNMAAGDFVTLHTPMKIELGRGVAHFRMAAASTVAAGLYTLQFSKTGDTGNLYSAVPPLTLVVSTKKCSLTTFATAYNVPVGGNTLPIVIQGVNCIPVENITLSVTFDVAGLQVLADLSSLTLKNSTLDGKMYIVLRHIDASLTLGSIVTASFSIGGTNAASY